MKISLTAAYLAVKFYGLTRDPNIASFYSPFVRRFYENLISYLPNHLSWYQRSLKVGILRRFFVFSEELLLPGDLMHVLCRKYYLTRMVEDAIETGIEQVVNLGAGFDHLCAFTSSKGIPSFELDLPFMIDQKKAFLEHAQLNNSSLHLQRIDFNESSLADILLSMEEFDPKKNTLFIAEGFFDYLSLMPSERILEDIRSLNLKNRLLSTFFSLDELPFLHQLSFRSGVSMVGESLKFKLTKPEFVELFSELGFELETELSHTMMKDDLVKKMGSKLPVLKGFYILDFNITA